MVLSRSDTNLGAAISRSQRLRRAFCRKSQDCSGKNGFKPCRHVTATPRFGRGGACPASRKQRRGDTHKSFSKLKEALFESTLAPPLGGIPIDPLNCANDTSLTSRSCANFCCSWVGSSHRLLRHPCGGNSKAGRGASHRHARHPCPQRSLRSSALCRSGRVERWPSQNRIPRYFR